MIKVIIQKDDFKSKQWAKNAKKLGVSIIPLSGSPLYTPLKLVETIAVDFKPDYYVVRYLNDYNSLLKTLIRYFSELLSVLICKVFAIRLIWICHNVDKESNENYPRITYLRRNLFKKSSYKIFVTDELLIDKAIEVLSVRNEKVDFVTFGKTDVINAGTGDEIAENFIKKIKQKNKTSKILVTLCAGTPNNEKYLHFSQLPHLIDNAKKNEITIVAIIAGNWDSSVYSDNLLKIYKSYEGIYVFEEFTTFSSSFIKNYIDFYFRGYSDYSVPFTVYEAASHKKPILAINEGFLPNLILQNDLGQVISKNFSDFSFNMFDLQVSEDACETFLQSHNWSLLGIKLKQLHNVKVEE